MNLPELAKLAIEKYVCSGVEISPPESMPDGILSHKAGAFVSIHKKDGSLRGCIGTIFPSCNNVASEVIKNAISAATKDNRFNPLVASEIDKITVSVDVLGKPEVVKDSSELDPRKYGVIVSTLDGKSGVLLPNLEGVDSVWQQIEICLQKAGIKPREEISVSRFEVKRYEHD